MTARLADAAEAGERLRRGELVAFPTETVYGLGADATQPEAVAGIFAAKQRPRFNPLICHVADPEAALALADFGPLGRRLAARFWPGPLTLVGPRPESSPIAELASAGAPTLAVRVPGNPLARELLAAAGTPVAAPSANRAGRLSPTTAAHVLDQLDGRIAAVLDGGACTVGIESTVVGVTGDRAQLLRLGGIAAEALAESVGAERLETGETPGMQPSSPGQLASHYAPSAPVRLDAAGPGPGEAWLGFGPDPAGTERAAARANLSPAGDPAEAAARLYACLHELAAAAPAGIAVAPIPEAGLGAAINDRLRRAAAARAELAPGSAP